VAPLERCAELLGVDLGTIAELAASVEPYIRADGTEAWSLTQLERKLRPEAYRMRRGGYIDRRRTLASDTRAYAAMLDDLRDTMKLPSALSQLREPKGPRPAVPPNRGRPLVTAHARARPL
jgi:hypothetical protein